MEYEDFVIQIDPDEDGRYTARVLGSPAGEGRGSFTLPDLGSWPESAQALSGAETAGRLRDAVPAEATRDLRWRRPQGRGLTARELGDELFRAVFSDQVRSLYDQSLGSLGAGGERGLRVKLKLQSSDPRIARLEALPWELLHRPETDDYLSLSRMSSVVRYLDVPRPVPPARQPRILRVLVAIASPRGLEPLDLARERRWIEDAWSRQAGVELVVLEKASAGALRRTLVENPCHVLHFMGHGGFDAAGGVGVLYLESPDGSPEPTSGQALATKLKDFRSLRLVFLNACKTAQTSAKPGVEPFAGVASALVLGGLPAVVAMQRPISDRAAIDFSQAFYRVLAAGEPVDTAVTEGRQAIHSGDVRSVEWATPVLFMRVPDGRIFQAPAPRRRGIPRSVAGSVAVLLLVAGTTFYPGFRDALFAPQRPVLEISQSFASNVEGLTGVVTLVEILDSGRMRIHFEFVNTTDEPQDVGFDYRESYLADEFGNAYEVLATDYGTALESVVLERIEQGGKRSHWIELDAPRDSARRFHVNLESHERSAPFPFFEVELPPYPEELSRRSRPAVSPPGSQRVPLDQKVETAVAGLDARLSRIELLASRRMRWNLELWNRTQSHQRIAVDYRRSYVVDELGQRYPVVGYDTAQQPYQGWLVKRALRQDHWLELPGPRGGARKLKIVVFAEGAETAFASVEVNLPEYDARYAGPPQPSPPPPPLATPVPEPSPPPVRETPALSAESAEEPEAPLPPPPVPSLVVYEGEVPLRTNRDDVLGKLTRIERLDNGRMRWHVEVWNHSEETLDVGFDYGGTYLSDNLGTMYKLLAAGPHPGTGGTFQTPLRSGAQLSHWFEFSGPVEGAKSFLVVLGSHDPSALRYRPVTREIAE